MALRALENLPKDVLIRLNVQSYLIPFLDLTDDRQYKKSARAILAKLS